MEPPQKKPKIKESKPIDMSLIGIVNVKEKLEKEGEEKVKEDVKTGGTIDDIMKIMSDGSKEFTQKTGRNMTYGEMREMYG
jgi:hypothetical protein